MPTRSLVLRVLAVATLAAGLASPASAAPDSLVRAITLAEAVTLARQHAPQMVSARGRLRTGAASVRSAWGAFLPSASLSAGSSRQVPSNGGRTRVENGQIVTLPDEPWSYSLGWSTSLDLFDGGRRWFGLRQARADVRAAVAGEVSQRYATALSVRQAFFDVLAARESRAAAEAQLAQAQQQRTASVARLKVHTVTRSDSLRAEIQVRSAALAVLDATTALAVANASLTQQVGTADPVTAADDDGRARDPLPYGDAALRAMAEQGPVVRAARASLEAARAVQRSAYGAYLPSLSAGYSRSNSGTGETLLPESGAFSGSGSLRLSLSLPLFNQFQREQQVVAARVGVEQAEAEWRDALLAARADFTERLGAFRSAEVRVASQTATLEAAEEDLRVQQQRYAAGGSTQLDVLTSQTQLDQARRDLIRARYDLRIARAQIEALVGRDL